MRGRLDRRHVYRHWFPRPKYAGNPEESTHGGWFEDHQPVARVVRMGLVSAIDRLIASEVDHGGGDHAAAKTLDSYWVCAGHTFEVAVLESDRQITLIFMTPSPAMTRRGSNFGAGWEDIYVSKHTAQNPGEREVPGYQLNHAITVRLREPV